METASLQAMAANWASYLGVQEQAAASLEDRRALLRGEVAAAVYGLATNVRQALRAFQRDAPYSVEVRAVHVAWCQGPLLDRGI